MSNFNNFFGANALKIRLLFYHFLTILLPLRLYPTPFSNSAFTTEEPTPMVILFEIPDTEIHHVSNQCHSHQAGFPLLSNNPVFHIF